MERTPDHQTDLWKAVQYESLFLKANSTASGSCWLIRDKVRSKTVWVLAVPVAVAEVEGGPGPVNVLSLLRPLVDGTLSRPYVAHCTNLIGDGDLCIGDRMPN